MPVPGPDTSGRAPRRLLTDDVFDRLRDDIIRGRLEPGQRIHDQELAASLGFSRATIRTALLRLKHAGLVEAVPNLYTRVTPLNLRRYLETQDTAAALYLFAVRYATPLLSDDSIERLRAWHAQVGRGRERREVADSEVVFTGGVYEGFFRVFLDTVQNGPLERTLDRLRPHLQRTIGLYSHLLPTDIIDESFRAAIEGAARRDDEATSAAMRMFLYDALGVFNERLAEQPELQTP